MEPDRPLGDDPRLLAEAQALFAGAQVRAAAAAAPLCTAPPATLQLLLPGWAALDQAAAAWDDQVQVDRGLKRDSTR